MKNHSGDIADDLLILNRITIERIFKEENAGNLIALYVLYYHTAKWQRTNQIWATNEYCMKKLGWGKDKLIAAKSGLESMDLIEQITARNNDGTFEKQYIGVKYVMFDQRAEKPPAVKPESGKQPTYALNTNTVDALSINKDMLGETEVSRETKTFEEWMNSLGLEEYEYPTDDGIVMTFKGPSGSVLSAGKLREFRGKYDKAFGKKEGVLERVAKASRPRSEEQQVFDVFSHNPASVLWRQNLTQKRAARELLALMSVSEIKRVLEASRALREVDMYGPEMDTPYEMLTKLAKLRNRTEKSGAGMGTV